jgi:uncharacterized protein GlcG (DUF336 family)
MKLCVGLLAAIAAAGLAGAVSAATLNDVVIKGPMAEKINEKNELSVAVAEKIAQHCVADAASHQLPVAVTLLDQFGTVIYSYRADGLGKTQTESALLKAKTALQTRAPTHAVQNRITLGQTTDAAVYIQGMFPNSGGLPIVVEHQFLGTVGVGGMPATPTWSDEICGWNALNAVIGQQPPLLENAVRPGAAPPAAPPAAPAR